MKSRAAAGFSLLAVPDRKAAIALASAPCRRPNWKNRAKNTEKYGQKSGKNPIFDVFRPFWPVFGVPEVRDPFKKLPGGDTLLFHRL